MVKKIYFYIFLLFFFCSCANMSTNLSHYGLIEKNVKFNNFSGAINNLENAKEKAYKEKEKVLYYLELGMLYHYNREFEKSNEFLGKAEDGIYELYTKSISKEALSYLLNDNALPYSGEDYEDIYINIFKSLNYIQLGLEDDAYIEVNRVNHKLNNLEDKYKKLIDKYNSSNKSSLKAKLKKIDFNNDVLARYLSMLLYSLSNKYNDAEIDYKKIEEAFKLQGNIYYFNKPNLDNLLKKTKEIKVNFFCFSGKSPIKKANTFYLHSEKNMIFVATSNTNKLGKNNLNYLDQFIWPGVDPGLHLKFQTPYIQNRNSEVAYVQIVIDSTETPLCELLEDVDKVAEHTFEVKRNFIYMKTLIRAISKAIASGVASKQIEENTNEFVGLLARVLTNALVDATENADLRISRFFPSKVRIKELLLEEGKYNISINYLNKDKKIIFTDDLGLVGINKNKLNIFESFCLK